MDLPLVTVGVASFNNAAYLRETLDSIRQQTYPNVELLVVDDASRDDSAAVAEAWFASHPEVRGRLIRHSTNLGVCRVCNDIVTEGEGEFISIIGSDDIFRPDKLAIQVPLLQGASDRIGVVFSPIERIDAAGHPLPPPADLAVPHQGQVHTHLLRVNFIAAMGALVRRSCYERVGLYDETLAYEDWDMWLRIAREYEFLYSPVPSALYRIHAGSATFSRRTQLAEASLRLLQKHRGLSPETDAIIAGHTRLLAETLYHLGSPSARQWLRTRLRQAPDALGLGLLLAASLGLKTQHLRQAKSWLRRLTGAQKPA